MKIYKITYRRLTGFNGTEKGRTIMDYSYEKLEAGSTYIDDKGFYKIHTCEEVEDEAV